MANLVGPPAAQRWVQEFAREAEAAQEKTLLNALLAGAGGRTTVTLTHNSLAPLPCVGDETQEPGFVSMGTTQNGSATFKATGSSCLDFFFHVHQLSTAWDVRRRLALAWAEDPHTALRLVMQLRAVRGTGKSDKAGFFHAAMWIYEHHPRTLLANLWLLPAFGCFKDLLVLVRRAADQDPEGHHDLIPKLQWQGGGKYLSKAERLRRQRLAPREERVIAHEEEMRQRSRVAAEERRERRARDAAKVLGRYQEDWRFRALHDEVGRVFAEALRKDMEAVNGFLDKGGAAPEEEEAAGEVAAARAKWKGRKGPRLSLAAKWAPSLDRSFDRRTLLAESIARQYWAACEEQQQSPGEADAPSAFALRDRLRKEVLVPLRVFLELPEAYMSAGRWGELPYSRVPSVCMKNNKKHFKAHDGARFAEYMADVATGKAKIAAGAVLPHDILRSARDSTATESSRLVGELQWQQMVQDVKTQGTLTNCIAVCDVSGSMMGLPMEVAVALSLLISEISSEPWKGHVITFSESPEIHRVQGRTVAERAEFTERMHWGMNTDFQRVFDRILERAVAHKIEPAGMAERVYVFSDMEFDQANASDRWATDHEEIVRKFSEAGYPVPRIVYWNLSQHRTGSTPVSFSEPGAALVSGFSKNILTALMKGQEVTPLEVMQGALQGKLFEELRVVD